MKKMLLIVFAAALLAGAGQAGTILAPFNIFTNGSQWAEVGYQNDPYAAQASYDSFNYSVRQRMSIARLGVGYGGTMASASLGSADALGATPSSRSAYASNGSSRQIDCVYNNGFTIWGDAYGSWTRQKTTGLDDGYRYNVYGPALGFDWSNGAFTAGIATTYNWGKISDKGIDHDRDTRTWAVTGYGQWTNGAFYANATFGYGRNRYSGSHSNQLLLGNRFGVWTNYLTGGAKYYSDSWNANAEVGYKFNLRGFTITPNVGLRYFTDRREAFSDVTTVYSMVNAPVFGYTVNYDKNNYHVLELPVGVTLGYEFRAGNAVIAPQFRFAWVPELDHKRSSTTAWDTDGDFYWLTAPERKKNAFLLGTGIQAKFNQTVSAHLDYNVTLRSKAYEHHLNLGVGFTF